MLRSIVTSICCLGLVASATEAGVKYTVESQPAGSDEAMTAEILVDSGRMRIDPGEGEGVILFDGARQEMTVLNHSERSYMVMDRAMVDQMVAAVRQMEQALASVPEAQREQMRQMMQQQMGQAGGQPLAAPELVELGESGSAAGMSCSWKAVQRNGVTQRKLCVADLGALPGGDELAAVQKQMAQFIENLTAAASAGMPGGMMPGLGQSIAAEMALVKGFPVITEQYMAGSMIERSTFMGAENVSASDADFAPPPDYQRLDMGSMMGGRRPGRRN